MMKRKKGFTITELMVSMTLFSILTTLVMVGFINIARIRALTGSMKDSQQKLRLVEDQLDRMAKEATSATINTNPDPNKPGFLDYKLTLNYDAAKNGGTPASIDYTIKTYPNGRGSLFRTDRNCFFADPPLCTATEEDILGRLTDNGTVNLDITDSLIEWVTTPTGSPTTSGAFPLSIRIKLDGSIANGAFFTDRFMIDTNIVLEGLK